MAPALNAQPNELEAVGSTVRVKSDHSRSLPWRQACSKLGALPLTVRGKNPGPGNLTNSGVGGVQMADVSVEVLNEAGYKPEDVKLFIPHQANQRITEAVASRLDVDPAIVYSNIAYHGNTSSASIPIALDECIEAGKVQEGDLILLASFGGGVTWGGVLLKW